MKVIINQDGIATLIIALNNSITKQKETIQKQGYGGFQNINQNQLDSAREWLNKIEASIVLWQDCNL